MIEFYLNVCGSLKTRSLSFIYGNKTSEVMMSCLEKSRCECKLEGYRIIGWLDKLAER